MELSGSDIIMECLIEQKVDTIFGFPGGQVINLYDSIYKYRDRVKHILTSHEQGASHAADGYARATGRAGVCIATSGPGATNLVTGIATSYMDSTPLVAITGNVPQHLLGKDSFQEVDITGITMPITKHNYIVKDITKLADTIREAFKIAQSGRPGPVLVDVPKDIQIAKTEYTYKEPEPIVQEKKVKLSEIQNAIRLIEESRKPLIYIGGGVITSGAEKELLAFVNKINAPVSSSLMGLGGFPGDDVHFIGMIGMHGTKTSNLAATECDLLIAIGARFSDRVISNVKRFASRATILHIDIDPAEISKNVVTFHSIIGDVKEVLSLLSNKMKDQERSKWMSVIRGWKEMYPVRYSETGTIRAQHIMEKIQELAGDNAIITTDVGQHQIWAAQTYCYKEPRTFISSGGLGTMGFGIGAAIGVKLARPDKTVINITGDGCFRMNCIELATAIEYDVPIIIVIMNNHALGMVRQWQALFFDARFSETDIDRSTDFIKLTEAYGAVGLEIKSMEDIEPVLKKALSCDRAVVINCEVGINEKVFPMVPPGAAIDELIMENEI